MIKNRKNINKTYFDHPGINKNLKSKAIQGGSISILAKILNTIIQIAGVTILARLLSPNDFGLVAMATVITGFFFVFHELGLETGRAGLHDSLDCLSSSGMLFFRVQTRKRNF